MEGIHRQLLEGEQWVGDSTGPFFGFMGAAAALVFACARSPPLRTRVFPCELARAAERLLGCRARLILAACFAWRTPAFICCSSFYSSGISRRALV